MGNLDRNKEDVVDEKLWNEEEEEEEEEKDKITNLSMIKKNCMRKMHQCQKINQKILNLMQNQKMNLLIIKKIKIRKKEEKKK